MNKIFIFIYLTILIAEIISGELGIVIGVFFLKPALVTALILLVSSHGLRKHLLFILALTFSLIGDILLMIKLPNLFLFGLGSFLITHLLYIRIFSKNATFNLQITVSFLTIIALFFWFVLKPNVPPAFAIPVFSYMIVITVMGITANSINSSKETLYLLAAGAILFIVSDSLIAVDRFVAPIPYPTFFIMSTYGIAQLLITKGYLRQR